MTNDKNCKRCIDKVNKINESVGKILVENYKLKKEVKMYEEIVETKNELIRDKQIIIERLGSAQK